MSGGIGRSPADGVCRVGAAATDVIRFGTRTRVTPLAETRRPSSLRGRRLATSADAPVGGSRLALAGAGGVVPGIVVALAGVGHRAGGRVARGRAADHRTPRRAGLRGAGPD